MVGGGSGHRMWQTFFQIRYIQIDNRYMKRCSTSLLIREMHIKTTMRRHHTPVSMAITKKNIKNKRWQGCWIPCWWNFPVGGNGSCCSHYGKQYGSSSKKNQNGTTTWSSNSEGILKEKNTNLTRYVPPLVFIAGLFTITKI